MLLVMQVKSESCSMATCSIELVLKKVSQKHHNLITIIFGGAHRERKTNPSELIKDLPGLRDNVIFCGFTFTFVSSGLF